MSEDEVTKTDDEAKQTAARISLDNLSMRSQTKVSLSHSDLSLAASIELTFYLILMHSY